jgi:hypothetical protein
LNREKQFKRERCYVFVNKPLTWWYPSLSVYKVYIHFSPQFTLLFCFYCFPFASSLNCLYLFIGSFVSFVSSLALSGRKKVASNEEMERKSELLCTNCTLLSINFVFIIIMLCVFQNYGSLICFVSFFCNFLFYVIYLISFFARNDENIVTLYTVHHTNDHKL